MAAGVAAAEGETAAFLAAAQDLGAFGAHGFPLEAKRRLVKKRLAKKAVSDEPVSERRARNERNTSQKRASGGMETKTSRTHRAQKREKPHREGEAFFFLTSISFSFFTLYIQNTKSRE
jgi:hypothetical protein